MPFFLPPNPNLTEATSLDLFQRIQSCDLLTPLSDRPIATSYVRQGEGDPPILLLHGFDSSLMEYRRLLPQLATQFQTWAVDLLGFGFSERLDGLNFGAIAIKTHLYHFWQIQIQRPIVLVGASMGGATAIDFALTYPDAVSHLILIDSAGLTQPPLSANLMFPPFDGWATAFLRNLKVRQAISRAAYCNKSFASDDARTCAALHLACPRWGDALVAFTKSGGYGSFAPYLPQLTQPTLILWGERDRILGTKAAHQFQRLIPHSQLTWIPQAGHVPHLEKPILTAEAIAPWLQRAGTSPDPVMPPVSP
jgi:pimeloyl-ACP methyl ester carboxylesterase